MTNQNRVETESGAMVRACVELLKEKFPATFGDVMLPLRVGIDKEVHKALDGQFGRKIIEASIGRRVRQRGYLDALMKINTRVGLNGEHAGSVSATERDKAAEVLRLMDSRGGPTNDGPSQKERAKLLKRFEASTKTEEEFADLVGLDVGDLRGRMALAWEERRKRQDEARALVEKWRTSGLSRNQFCRQFNIKQRKLEAALDRMGAVHSSQGVRT